MEIEQSVQVPELDKEFINSINQDIESKRVLERKLQNLSLGADQKAVLSRLLNTVIEVGEQAIAIGRAIITFVLDLIKLAPGTTFGALVGVVVGSLVASVPVIGLVLGPIIAPLMTAFGIAAGAFGDLTSGRVGEKIELFVERYAPLRA